MNEITYQNKVALNENPEIADINKVTDDDMNEIKSVVNGNSKISSNNFGLGTDTWTSSGTYAIGDIVVYNDNTYKNLTGTNTTTPPDQDSTNWEVLPLILNVYNTSTKNAYACDYANNHQLNAKILWTNSNPTSPMSPGTTINLSSSDYDILEIFYVTHVFSERNIKSIRALKSFDIDLEVINEAGTPYTRKISRTNDTSYSAGSGYTYTSYGGGKTGTVNVCVPLYIIGYKTGLFN